MLTDLKVIDLSSVLAGPSVGMFFAELGAKVIKIEHPDHADVTRSWKLPSEDKHNSVSAYFASVNYLKEYIKLDLKLAQDHASFMRLIQSADVLLTNFKSGDALKLNITDDSLFKVNPSLIIGKISGYGEDSDKVAYDLILQAESGFMSMNGTPESGPVKMPVALIDILAAHHLKEGILLALYEREKSKKGKSVNVSLYDAAISSLANQASNYLMTGQIPQRMGSLHPNIAPYGELFTTKDGATITFAIGSNMHFQKLCGVLGLEGLSENEKYSSNQSRVIHRNELQILLQEKVADLSSTELIGKLNPLHVPVGKVKNLKEVLAEEAAKNLIRSEEINDITTQRITSVVFK